MIYKLKIYINLFNNFNLKIFYLIFNYKFYKIVNLKISLIINLFDHFHWIYTCQNSQLSIKKKNHLISFIAIDFKFFFIINNYVNYQKQLF